MNDKIKNITKYFLLILFVAYYLNINLFYHTHIVDGKEVIHSHFFWKGKDAQGKPIKHSHPYNTLKTIKILSHFIVTFIAGFITIKAPLLFLNKSHISSKRDSLKSYLNFNYSLRAPPVI